MRIGNRFWYVWVIAVLLSGCFGCGSEDGPDNPGNGGSVNENGTNGSTEQPKVPEPEPPAEIAEVNLPADYQGVLVGQDMPTAELSDTAGNQQTLSGLYGEKLTVLCFWSGGGPFGMLKAEEMLKDLQANYAEAYAEKGLKVVGVNKGDAADVVSQQMQEFGVTFPMLLDLQGAFSEQVAEKFSQRVYLLDADGKVLWFDTEYSEPTREDLRLGVQVVLGEIE